MKHTPGSWRIGRPSVMNGIQIFSDSDWPNGSEAICTMGKCNKTANARLIASAPELFEACKSLISNAVWDGKTREHGSANEYTVHRAVIEATQRAINKAEGREGE